MTSLTFYIPWIAFLILGLLAWHFSNKAKHEERKMLIGQGVNIEELFKKSENRRRYWLLKIGIVVIGLGAAFVLIAILNSLHLLTQDALYPGIFCLFGGTSMVIAHKVGKKDNND